jgi:EpsI family protein
MRARLLLALSAVLFLFGTLLFLFPFNSGDSVTRTPLAWSLWSMWTTSNTSSQDYSYCLLVPVIVAYLVFEQRSRLALLPGRQYNAAIGWILCGLIVFLVGSRAGKPYLGCAGIQILLAGVILWFAGKDVFRALLFPWAFLTFAWPLPFIDTAVAFPLRMIVSHLAYGALNILGIPCLQNGTSLLSAPDPLLGLPTGARFQIDVADPCSGIHSLLALLMLSALYSHFFLPRIWQQWTLFLSAIPFTIVGNVFRIFLLVVGTLNFGASFSLGTNDNPSWFHESCGFAVFAVVLGLEFLLGSLLIAVGRRFANESPSTVRAHQPANPSSRKLPRSSELIERPDPPPGSVSGPSVEAPYWRSGIILGLCVLVIIVWQVSPPPYLPPEPGVFMSLPHVVELPQLNDSKFFGLEAPVSDAEHRLLPKDTEFARKNYDDFHGHQIFFSIVLSGVQQYTIHRPQICLVAQGWDIVSEGEVSVQLSSGHKLAVRDLSLQRETLDENNQHQLIHACYLYWYVAEGVTTPSYAERSFLSGWDRVFHNRDHRWAYITAMSLITDSLRPDGLNPDETRNMLTAFIREILPNVQKSEMLGQTTTTD